MKTYDVLIIGSGTAGQTAARHLSAAGLAVAMIERSDRPGGTCAQFGCQPKKWFYEATALAAKCRHLEGKGLKTLPVFDWRAIQARKTEFTSSVPAQTRQAVQRMGVDFFAGHARFVDSTTLSVGHRKIRAAFIIVASGARPMPLPIEGQEYLLTSKDFLDLAQLPEQIVFIGGGFISFEFAHFAARLGPPNGKTTILEVRQRPLGPFDADMVEALVAASRDDGIAVFSSVQIERIEQHEAGLKVKAHDGRIFNADIVVNGAGRVPNVESLDLEAAGIDYDRKGIAVDAEMRTSNPTVFAVGDCAATIQLARVADFEARTAAENIIAALNDSDPAPAAGGTAPAVLFTYPQYAMVGQTEAALIKQEATFRRDFKTHLKWPSYTRIGLKHAAYKMLVGENDRILGAHVLSDAPSGLINTIRWAMNTGMRVQDLYRESILSPYPTRVSDLIYMLNAFE